MKENIRCLNCGVKASDFFDGDLPELLNPDYEWYCTDACYEEYIADYFGSEPKEGDE